MAKVLILPLGVGLAHVGRSIVYARELMERKIDVVFGIGSEGAKMMKKEGLPHYSLPEFGRSAYDEKLKKSNPSVYTRKIVERFVAAELKLYEKVKPDVIVFDMRMTARISSQIAKIPVISVNNVDACGYYDYSKIKFPANTALVRYLPKKILSLIFQEYGQKVLDRIGPHLLQAILLREMIKLSPGLIRLGYKLTTNPYQLFIGDLTLLADIPEYRSVKELPPNMKLVGPIFWDGIKKLPAWHTRIKNSKNVIYVTASGTGDREVFLRTLEYLKDTNFTVIATTGNTLKPNEVNIQYPGLFVTDYLPGSFALSKAKLAIFPGGNATAYQALSRGVPQICTPLFFDQEDNANQLERLRTGIIVNPYVNFNRETLLTAVGKIMVDRTYKDNALKYQKVLANYHGAKTAAEEIIKFIGKIKSRNL